jgi:hypothetical protein
VAELPKPLSFYVVRLFQREIQEQSSRQFVAPEIPRASIAGTGRQFEVS